MKFNNYETPQLFVKKGGILAIDGEFLPKLMLDVFEKDMLFRFCARGNSMKPVIKDGDVITVKKINYFSARIGDIVAFVHPLSQRLIVHRIIAIRSDKFLILGDNLACKFDGFIPKEKILGKITKIERDNHSLKFGLGLEKYFFVFLNLFKLSIIITKRVFKYH